MHFFFEGMQLSMLHSILHFGAPGPWGVSGLEWHISSPRKEQVRKVLYEKVPGQCISESLVLAGNDST